MNASSDSCNESRLPRRKWLKRVIGIFAGGTAGVGFYTRFIEPTWVEVVRKPMPVVNLPESLEGCTLVQISDIHIGHQVDDGFLVEWFKEVATWKPDIVVFTGDFLTLRRDHSVPTDQMKDVLTHFPRGKLATFGILGNHDYGVNWSDSRVADSVTVLAQDSGLDIIRNETRNVDGLQIVGFDDYWGTNFGGAKVLKHVDLGQPTLVLCHNPDVVDLPIWSGYRGWILSGHTHGGQCKVPFFRPPMLPIHNKCYSSGEIALADGRRLYVNRALGHSMPVRFNVRPEVTVFQLTGDHPCNDLARSVQCQRCPQTAIYFRHCRKLNPRRFRTHDIRVTSESLSLTVPRTMRFAWLHVIPPSTALRLRRLLRHCFGTQILDEFAKWDGS